jgi:DNA-binding transcriptional regulator YhcF (GntR family)
MQITEDIQNGKFASGVLLPPDGELASDYDVSRITLRKSLAILSQKGRIRRLPQGGALATPPTPSPVTSGCGSESSSQPIRTNKKLAMGMVLASGSSYSVIHRFNGARRYAEENNLKITHFLLPSHEEALNILSRVEEYELDGVIVSPYLDDRYFQAFKKLVDKNIPQLEYYYRDQNLGKYSSVQLHKPVFQAACQYIQQDHSNGVRY